MLLVKENEGLWRYKYTCPMLGIKFPSSTYIIKIGQKLLVVSPGRWDEQLSSELSELGEVGWLFTPNAFHHVFYHQWQRAYPEAEHWGLKATQKRAKTLQFSHLYHGERTPFGDSVELCLLEGAPSVSEVAIFIPQSKSLIFTDFIFNVNPPQPWFTRLMLQMVGVYNRVGTSKIFRSSVVDKKALQKSVIEILKLDFDRVYPNHGQPITKDAQQTLEQSLGWLFNG